MKSSTIRFIVVLATLSILGITITQFYWVKRAFDLKEAEFDRHVNTALLNVAQQLFEINHTPAPASNPIRQLSTNYYVVMVNGEINASVLEFLLRSEFEKRNITSDFEYGIYDCDHEKMVYGNYVTLDDAKKKSNTQASLPNWSSSGYYFGVQFPNRETQILNQMGIWLFSTLVLLIVILFFGYTLFVILKQKRLSEIQRDFINTMTHEFKTPISTIAVSAEVLKDPAILHQPERLLSYTAIIENENNRLKHHVERVLQMARIQPGGYREELKKEMTDLHELIRDTSASMGLGLAEKGGTLELDLQANPGSVMADRHHMANVLFNLLDNAIKYCNHTPHIRIATRTQSNTVLMTVTDNGIGISAENQNRIFEKFFRVNTGNVHNVKGFGLGLHYVQQIIHAHRGKISLTSTPGEGCCFTVTLPYA